jgi:hypothetical protein
MLSCLITTVKVLTSNAIYQWLKEEKMLKISYMRLQYKIIKIGGSTQQFNQVPTELCAGM